MRIHGLLDIAVNLLLSFWFIILTVNTYCHFHLGTGSVILALGAKWKCGHFVKKWLGIRDNNSRSLNQVRGPSMWRLAEHSVQWSCPHDPQTFIQALLCGSHWLSYLETDESPVIPCAPVGRYTDGCRERELVGKWTIRYLLLFHMKWYWTSFLYLLLPFVCFVLPYIMSFCADILKRNSGFCHCLYTGTSLDVYSAGTGWFAEGGGLVGFAGRTCWHAPARFKHN